MCNDSCIIFGKKGLTKEEISGKKVIEIGSLDVNGSLRSHITSLKPSLYVGTDIKEGLGVDIICSAEDIIEKFGKNSFDIVISTELLEHVKDWRKVISNIKNICKSDGIILVTTRSQGFPFHSYPYDFWRYELEDMSNIFSDCHIMLLEKDSQQPGIFVNAKKLDNFVEKDLSDYTLYNITHNSRIKYNSTVFLNNNATSKDTAYDNIPKTNIPKVLIGIPTYNGAHRVDWLLQSISERTSKDIDYKIVVCDDSGNKEHQEKTKAVVDKWSFSLPISLLINDKNIGVSKSWNNIIVSEDSQYIILANDDIVVNKGWLENIVYFLHNNLNIGAAFYDFIKIEERDIPRMLSDNFQKLLHRSQSDNFDYRNTLPIRRMHYVGGLFGFSRDKYNMVGGFDKNYHSNFEETDFCTALAACGNPSYILTYPKYWHIYSATFKSSPELNYQNIFEKSSQYYNNKWNGDRETNSERYMSKIPFQKIRWMCNNNTYEEILTDSYGYFKIELGQNNDIKIIA